MIHRTDAEQPMILLLLGRLQVEVTAALVGTAVRDVRDPILEG